jgi:hypothetical protein
MISVIFLTGFIPIVMGIIDYSKENRRLDRKAKNAEKVASQHVDHI